MVLGLAIILMVALVGLAGAITYPLKALAIIAVVAVTFFVAWLNHTKKETPSKKIERWLEEERTRQKQD